GRVPVLLDLKSRFLFRRLRENCHEVGGGGREMDFTLATYYPIFIYLVVILGFAVSVLVVAHWIGPKPRPTAVKLMPYESGMDPIGDARQRFDVRFYLVAILFLVFDVELLFLYPWAASYSEGTVTGRQFGTVVFVEVLLYLA